MGYPLFASDLDGTLLHHATTIRDSWTVVAESPAARLPASVMTNRALQLLVRLSNDCLVVPVTARSLQGYRNVTLPYQPHFAVVANGATILVDGHEDLEWTAHVEDLRSGVGDPGPVLQVLQNVEGLAGIRVNDVGMVLADIIDPAAIRGSSAELPASMWGSWYPSVQHSKLHVVPPHLSKQDAVEEVVRRTEPDLLLAAGDSRMDQEMLLRADQAWRPAEGELEERLWMAPNMVRAPLGGPPAGEWILSDVRRFLRSI